MSALTRSKPSFIIYRDDPDAPSNTSVKAAELTATSDDLLTVTSPRPAPSISTSLSFNDKENNAPYPTTAPAGKVKKPTKPALGPSKSAPPTPIASTSDAATRSALATKFIAASSSKSSSKSSKSKSSNTTKSKSQSSQSSTLKRSASSHDALPSDETAARPRVKRAASASLVTGKKRSTRSASKIVELPSLLETAEEGPDGLTAADRRAIELTQMPLADISAAFPTSEGPDAGGQVTTLSRKRSRANTLLAPASSMSDVGSSQCTTVRSSQPEPSTEEAQAATSCASPKKKLRLSPVRERAPQLPLPLPLYSQPTLIEEQFDLPNHEPTLLDLNPANSS